MLKGCKHYGNKTIQKFENGGAVRKINAVAAKGRLDDDEANRSKDANTYLYNAVNANNGPRDERTTTATINRDAYAGRSKARRASYDNELRKAYELDD